MMRDFWISINEKYQRNKSTIWFIVIVAVFVLLIIRNYNKILLTRGRETITPASGSVSSNNSKNTIDISNSEDDLNKVIETIGEEQEKNLNKIELFILLCNNNKVNAAYDCLSDDCKKELYPTKQKFIDEYYSVIFKISKEYDITEVKNDTYRVKYTNDSIATGGKMDSGDGIIDYITYDKDRKINISGLIKKEEPKITSIAPYFTVYIDKKVTYTDRVVYNIRVKNNTKADIYINDADNSNLYLKDKSNGIIDVNTSNMFDSDYIVTSDSTKAMELTFDNNYFNRQQITDICFENVVIKNKEYLDSTSEVVNPRTGEKEYEKVKTNYPEHYSWSVKLVD